MRRIINWFGLYVVLCAVNVAGLDLVNTLFGGGSLGGSHHKHNISTSHSEHSMALSSSSGGNHAAASVKVFHFILTPAWGVTASGEQRCRNNLPCNYEYASDIDTLEKLYRAHKNKTAAMHASGVTTVALYNVHTLYHYRMHKPQDDRVAADYRFATSEESGLHPKYKQMFPTTFPHFDGYSIMHPKGSFQRIISDAWLNQTTVQAFTATLTPFHQLIKGATYVATNCRESRESVVKEIREGGFRVDGLAGCLRSTTTEAVANKLDMKNDVDLDTFNKRTAISHYMFNLAFENQHESGYVTEKPFDALIAGTVPVYKGDSAHLKSLLPHPDAAIFLDDFKDVKSLVAYLNHLSQNETAYERHRAWRHDYTFEGVSMKNPMLRDTFWCKVCQWAVNQTFSGKSGHRGGIEGGGTNLRTSSKDGKKEGKKGLGEKQQQGAGGGDEDGKGPHQKKSHAGHPPAGGNVHNIIPGNMMHMGGGGSHQRSNHSRSVHKEAPSVLPNDVVPKSVASTEAAGASTGVSTATGTTGASTTTAAVVGDVLKTTAATPVNPNPASSSSDVPVPTSVVSTAGGALKIVPPFPSPTLFKDPSAKKTTTAATATVAATPTTATAAASTATTTAAITPAAATTPTSTATATTSDAAAAAAAAAKFPSLSRPYNHVNAGGVHTYNPPYTLSLNYFPHLFDKNTTTTPAGVGNNTTTATATSNNTTTSG